MEQKVSDIISAILNQLTEYGLSRATVQDYQVSLFRPIIRYCEKEQSEYYSEQCIRQFLSSLEGRKENGEISTSYFNRFRRAVNMITSYAKTGQADFSMCGGNTKYTPTDDHMALIEKILSSAYGCRKAGEGLKIPMKHFFCFVEDQNLSVSQITDETFFMFIAETAVTNKNSQQRIFRAVKHISAYLKNEGLSDICLDFSQIQTKHAPARIIEPYSQEELSRMIGLIGTSTSKGCRDYAIILLAFGTGLRCSDIVSLCFSDVDWKNGLVTIRQQKSMEMISLPLNAEIMNVLADYILHYRPACETQQIFLSSTFPPKPISRCTLYKLLRKYETSAGITHKAGRGFHSLRRSFATELSSADVPISIISSMLGHKDIDEDRPYLSYNQKQTAFIAMDFSKIPITSIIYKCGDSEMKGGGMA